MNLTSRSTSIIVVLFAGAVILSIVLGQPLFLSYVESGSMSPTLQPNDGFVALPSSVAGPVSEGDVITYRAINMRGGGLITHRVVEITDQGFITRGDANPVTDQASGEPPVSPTRVEAQALEVDGSILVIPNLGTAVKTIGNSVSGIQQELSILVGSRVLRGTDGLGRLMLGVGALLLVLTGLSSSGGKPSRSRSRKREKSGLNPRVIILVIALLLIIPTTAAMVAGSSTQEYGFVSSATPSEKGHVFESGSSKAVTYRISNPTYIPMTIYLNPETESVDIDREMVRLSPGGQENVTMTITAPGESGYFEAVITEHRYLPVLPRSILTSFHRLHPWTVLLVENALLFSAVTMITRFILGERRIYFRSRRRDTFFEKLFNQ